MIIPAIIFIIWDIYFTKIGVWSFNEKYIIGTRIAGLPIEEILFFFTVPYCCLFIYQCVKIYFPQTKKNFIGDLIFYLLILALMIGCLAIKNKGHYTMATFTLLIAFIFLLILIRNRFKNLQTIIILVSFSIILIPFLIMNGFLTSLPVVIYNDAENLGIRIFNFLPAPMNNIPVEDIFYGMLLFLMNVFFYEIFQKEKAS